MQSINKKIRLAIIGLGYVGLPLALEFAKKRSVIGFDINNNRINELNSGIDRNLEFDKKELNKSKKLKFTNSKRELNSAIKDIERQKPSLIEDVQRGRTKGERMLSDKQREFSDYKNKRVRVEVKYE